MAYDPANPPALLAQRVGSGVPTGSSNDGSPGGGTLWSYASTDNALTVNAPDYFANGDELGMEVGDVVQIYDTDAPLVTLAFVSAVTPGGAATTTAL